MFACISQNMYIIVMWFLGKLLRAIMVITTACARKGEGLTSSRLRGAACDRRGEGLTSSGSHGTACDRKGSRANACGLVRSHAFARSKMKNTNFVRQEPSKLIKQTAVGYAYREYGQEMGCPTCYVGLVATCLPVTQGSQGLVNVYELLV